MHSRTLPDEVCGLRRFFISVVVLGGAGPLKSVAPARRLVNAENTVGPGVGCGPDEGSRRWLRRCEGMTCRRNLINTIKALSSLFLIFLNEVVA